jgi:hypothetical protein
MYLRNLQSTLDKSGKKELTAAEFLAGLPFHTQTLTEPVEKETNNLHQQIADRNIMLQILKSERGEIISQAERGTNWYIYLLLLVTIAQFGVFYWTIFQIDWLGRLLAHSQAGISWNPSLTLLICFVCWLLCDTITNIEQLEVLILS